MAKNSYRAEPFKWSDKDPLAEQHELINEVITRTIQGGYSAYQDIDLKNTEAGRKIRESTNENACAFVRVLVARIRHHDIQADKARASLEHESDRWNWHMTPAYESTWPPRQAGWSILRQLLRRKLPLDEGAIVQMAEWMSECGMWHFTDMFYPVRQFIGAVERLGDVVVKNPAFGVPAKGIVQNIRRSGSKELLPQADRLEDFLQAGSEVKDETKSVRQLKEVPSNPALSGSPNVLVELKESLGILTGAGQVGSELIEVDRFRLREDSPLKMEHQLISRLLPEVVGRRGYDSPDLTKVVAGREMLALPLARRARLVLAVVERCAHGVLHQSDNSGDHSVWQSRYAVFHVLRELLNGVGIRIETIYSIYSRISAR